MSRQVLLTKCDDHYNTIDYINRLEEKNSISIYPHLKKIITFLQGHLKEKMHALEILLTSDF